MSRQIVAEAFDESTEVGVGLKGVLLYGRVMTGEASADKPAYSGTVKDRLHPFFEPERRTDDVEAAEDKEGQAPVSDEKPESESPGRELPESGAPEPADVIPAAGANSGAQQRSPYLASRPMPLSRRSQLSPLETHQKQIEMYGKMSGEQRLLIGLQLHEAACEMARDGIRARFPEADESLIEYKLRQRLRLAHAMPPNGTGRR